MKSISTILSPRIGDAHDRERPTVRVDHGAGAAVDGRVAGAGRELPEGGRLRGDRARPPDLGHTREWAAIRGGVGTNDDVGVEDAQERLEIAGLRSRDERIDDLPLAGERHVGGRRPAPRTRRRARLASWRVAVGVRSTIGAI